MKKVTNQDRASVLRDARLYYQRKLAHHTLYGFDKPFMMTWSGALKYAWKRLRQQQSFDNDESLNMAML